MTALVLAGAAPVMAQDGGPWWVHFSPLPGAVISSVPGAAPRPAGALQIEVSHILPFGYGVAGGYLAPSRGRAAAEVAGPWLEASFAYRFKLRFRGHVAPFAGPVAGLVWHDVDGVELPGASDPGDRWLERWYFGGRAGVDIPVGSGWPAVRVELLYRKIDAEAGLGGADVTTALIGFRWSRAVPGGAGD